MAFLGLELGKRSLQAHQSAINTTGHNIANAETEGYSRQIANLEAQTKSDANYGTIGIGVEVTSITRVRNEFIDDRIIVESSEKAKWETRETTLTQLEYIINEPSDQSIRGVLDEYWRSMQDLSSNPEDRAIRVTTKERSEDLASIISRTYDQLDEVRSDLDNNIKLEVSSINETLSQIAELNTQITKLEIDGNITNDLRDSRDLLTEKLSEVIDISVKRNDDEYSIIVGGRAAVQGGFYVQLETVNEMEVNDGLSQIKWKDTGNDVVVSNGNLGALKTLRDEDVVEYMNYMDELAVSIIDVVNETHQAGFDLDGQKGGEYFKSFDSIEELVDINGDGTLEANIYKIEGSVVTKDVEPALAKANTNVAAGEGIINLNGVSISYDTEIDSMENLITKINQADSGVTASLDPFNRMVLRGTKDSDFLITYIEDKSGTLMQDLGILKTGQTVFDYKEGTSLENLTDKRTAKPKAGAASNIEVAIENVDDIAAAWGQDTDGDGITDTANGVGDGSNALNLAGLKYQKSIGYHTYSEYFESMVADIGIAGQQATRSLENQEILISDLENRRQSEIGVSLDEEMANLIMFQHGYDAAAKYIQIVNEMLDTIINQM